MRVTTKSIIHQGIAILILLLCFFLFACRDTEDILIEDAHAKEMLFSITVPGSSSTKSQPMDGDDENDVQSVEILLFDTNGKYTHQPLYSNAITTDPLDNKVKAFSVKVPEGTFNIVVLANARQSLADIIGSISTGDTKSSVMEKLLLANAGKWNTDTSTGGYIRIPMWGEIVSLTVDANTPPNNPVNMIRMTSKIDVALTHANATSRFTLESIRLYNYNNKGAIAPTASNWNVLQAKVTAPSVPSTAQKPANPAQNPLLYDGTDITTAGVSSIGQIYTFEAAAGSSSSLQSNTCLVIGGIYTGDTQASYYRIDFAQTVSNTTTYFALLRNHHYKVNILEVSGPGLPTPTDAFNSRPVNIKAEIVAWNDALITDVVFDGQHMLGVSKGEFTLPRDIHGVASDGSSLSITTDNPSGWTVDKIVDGNGANINWLSLISVSGSAVSSGASGLSNVKLSLTENLTGTARVGFIHLKAGRLTYAVKVTQGINLALALSIKNAAGTQTVNELVFAAPINAVPSSQQFKMKWTPASSSVTATNYIIGNAGLSLDGSSGLPASGVQSAISDPSGEKLFTVQPTAISDAELVTDPFLVKVSKVDFTVSNGISSQTESIFLRQSTYNLVFSNVRPSYWTNAGTYTFNVRSNTNWQIKSITENLTTGTGSLLNLQIADNLKVGTAGSSNTGTGTPVSFTVVSNVVSKAGTVTVVFESPDSPKKFNDVTLVLNIINEYYPTAHKGWAGSNIYYDTSLHRLTFDDVGVTTHKTYQGVYFLGGSLYGISPVGIFGISTKLFPPIGDEATGLTWTTIPRLITSVSSNSPSGKTFLDRAYLYEITNEATGVGDICKHLTDKGWAPPGKKWRMPTSNEFNDISGYSIVGTFGLLASTEPYGAQSYNRGYNKSGIGTPFLPAAGYGESHQLTQVGSNGMYWTSSADGMNSYALNFANGILLPNTSLPRGLGFSIRCVVDE